MICRTGRLASGNYHVIVPVLGILQEECRERKRGRYEKPTYEKYLGTEDSEFDGVDATGCPRSVIGSGLRMLA
jgi:hypothetical protein